MSPVSGGATFAYMPALADDPRVNVNVRFRRSSVEKVDAIAGQWGWDRATTLRTILALGLRAWDRGERP